MEQITNKFREDQNKIKSIALVHERLYESSDLENVDLNEYTKKLVNDLSKSYGTDPKHIILKNNVGKIYIDMDTATSCGLIINELVSNSLKHAFKGELSDKIIIEFNLNDNYITMDISDNGIGMPNNIDFNNPDTLGLQLVKTLVNQIEGNIQYNWENGTQYSIKFKKG